MSRQQITSHYTRLLHLWPVDRLRPSDRQIQRLFESRISSPQSPSSSSTREVNAAYLLLDDTFGKQFPLSSKTLKPASDPEHFQKLARELEEVPERGWFARVAKRVGGMVRWR